MVKLYPNQWPIQVESIPVLVCIGVNQEGQKKVLGFQSGDKESASTWREFFRDLKQRGLDGSQVVLGVMDGLPGLEKVFREEFPHAKVQRCQVHVTRNVLAKVPKKLKKEVADDLRSIFPACWQTGTPPRRKRRWPSFRDSRRNGARIFPRQ